MSIFTKLGTITRRADAGANYQQYLASRHNDAVDRRALTLKDKLPQGDFQAAPPTLPKFGVPSSPPSTAPQPQLASTMRGTPGPVGVPGQVGSAPSVRPASAPSPPPASMPTAAVPAAKPPISPAAGRPTPPSNTGLGGGYETNLFDYMRGSGAAPPAPTKPAAPPQQTTQTMAPAAYAPAPEQPSGGQALARLGGIGALGYGSQALKNKLVGYAGKGMALGRTVGGLATFGAGTAIDAGLEGVDALGLLPQWAGGKGIVNDKGGWTGFGWKPNAEFQQDTSIGAPGDNWFGYTGPGHQALQYPGAALTAWQKPLRSAYNLTKNQVMGPVDTYKALTGRYQAIQRATQQQQAQSTAQAFTPEELNRTGAGSADYYMDPALGRYMPKRNTFYREGAPGTAVPSHVQTWRQRILNSAPAGWQPEQ